MTIEETVSMMIQAKHLLAEMREAQNVLWDKSLELEKLIGVDIDTSDDLTELELDDLLLERDRQDAIEKSRTGRTRKAGKQCKMTSANRG